MARREPPVPLVAGVPVHVVGPVAYQCLAAPTGLAVRLYVTTSGDDPLHDVTVHVEDEHGPLAVERAHGDDPSVVEPGTWLGHSITGGGPERDRPGSFPLTVAVVTSEHLTTFVVEDADG